MHVFGPFERFPLAAAPHVWVKLAGADRITRASGELLPYRGVDAGELLDVLIEAFPDARARHAILAANPARLYGFNG
jgi:predicted TIM-barrel fold metal-dependent hydrolase